MNVYPPPQFPPPQPPAVPPVQPLATVVTGPGDGHERHPRHRGALIGAIAVAILAVGGTVAVVVSRSGGGSSPGAGGTTVVTTASASVTTRAPASTPGTTATTAAPTVVSTTEPEHVITVAPTTVPRTTVPRTTVPRTTVPRTTVTPTTASTNDPSDPFNDGVLSDWEYSIYVKAVTNRGYEPAAQPYAQMIGTKACALARASDSSEEFVEKLMETVTPGQDITEVAYSVGAIAYVMCRDEMERLGFA